MITFKSTEDLSKLPATDPAHHTVKDLVDRLITEYPLTLRYAIITNGLLEPKKWE